MSEVTIPRVDQVADPTRPNSYKELFLQEGFKEWFGDWEAGKCNPLAIDAKTGLPKVFYHGTCRPFEEFADPSTTVSNQGVHHIDNAATFFFDNKEAAESYALNQEREIVETIAHLAGTFNLQTWNDAIPKWNELMSCVFDEGGDRSRVKIENGLVWFDEKPIGWDTEYAGLFGPEDLKSQAGVGTKELQPHLEKSKSVCEIADVHVPSWFEPRVVSAVVAFGVTDAEKANIKHLQGHEQDGAHAAGLGKLAVDTVVIGSELGEQLAVKDPNRILILASEDIPAV